MTVHEHNAFRCPAHVEGCDCLDLPGTVCNPYHQPGECPDDLDVLPGNNPVPELRERIAADKPILDKMAGDQSSLYRPDGSWSCTRDHVTEPCGDCDGCRQIEAENRAEDARTRLRNLP